MMSSENKQISNRGDDELSTSSGSADSEITSGSDDEVASPVTSISNGADVQKSSTDAFRTFLLKLWCWLCLALGISPPHEHQTKVRRQCALSETRQPTRTTPRCKPDKSSPPDHIPTCAMDKKMFFSEVSATSKALLCDQVVMPPRRQPAPKPTSSLAPQKFESAAYRRELQSVLRDLANSINVSTAVKRIRVHSVPKQQQSVEFCDILTRAAREDYGAARRLYFAFAAGLAAGGADSVFDHDECTSGLKFFFSDICDGLSAEVPQLHKRLSTEMIPKMKSAFSSDEVTTLVPPCFLTPQ